MLRIILITDAFHSSFQLARTRLAYMHHNRNLETKIASGISCHVSSLVALIYCNMENTGRWKSLYYFHDSHNTKHVSSYSMHSSQQSTPKYYNESLLITRTIQMLFQSWKLKISNFSEKLTFQNFFPKFSAKSQCSNKFRQEYNNQCE